MAVAPIEMVVKSRKRKATNWKPIWNCRLREIRREYDLSMDDICEFVKISKAGLSKIERGSDPMLTTALRIAEFCGLPMEKIWTLLEVDQ